MACLPRILNSVLSVCSRRIVSAEKRTFHVNLVYCRNRILFESSEIKSDTIRIPASDSRSKHILDILNLSDGDSLKIGIVNGKPATATVRVESEKTNNYIELFIREWGDLMERPRVDLLLAMPRPKNMKRIWSILGQLGLHNIYITNANKVERFYFDCQALQPDIIKEELLCGLEQANDTRMPYVSIQKKLKPLLIRLCSQATLDKLNLEVYPTSDGELTNVQRMDENDKLILAHPGGFMALDKILLDENTLDNPKSNKFRVLLAIGPEGGWTDSEVQMFEEFGFIKASYGPRPLRTDVAIVALVARIKEILNDW